MSRPAHKSESAWRLAMVAVATTIAMAAVVMAAAAAGGARSSPTGAASRQVAVVADTTATMQPELDALAAAWPGTDAVHLDNPLYHLVGFRDAAVYLGSTESPATFGGWLASLTAAEGGACPDGMLPALVQLARQAPGSRALLLSDAAPLGNRARLASVLNELVQQGIQVYPVVSGWCPGSGLTLDMIPSLSRLTGGIPFYVDESETVTATRAALNAIARADTLLVEEPVVDGLQTYDLFLDSTATTLDVDTTTSWVG